MNLDQHLRHSDSVFADGRRSWIHLIAVVPRVADLTGQLALIGDTLVPFWTDIRCR
jgi:hypothetical protein